MEKYISDIYTSLTYENALLKELTQEGALGEKKGPVIQRIKMRIQLMEEELAQQPDEDEDEEEEGVVEENKVGGCGCDLYIYIYIYIYRIKRKKRKN